MYDGSAKNKTQKKIYYEPIENIMFDDFVWSFLLKQGIHIEISTKYTFIVHFKQIISQHSNNQNIFRNAFIELINGYWFSKSRNIFSFAVVDLTSTISKGCEPILVDFSRLWHSSLAKGVNPHSLNVIDFDKYKSLK